MSDLYKKSYRGYLIDHHSPDPPVVTLDKLDIEEYERFFKEANINNLMLYCKDHWGVTYYDSEVGKRHPGLKEDWIKKLRPVLKRNNIEFNAYYCLEYDTWAPSAHPEWSTLKADGQPLRLTGRIPKWGMPCYETGYRQYVLKQLGEIVENYRPDSLFLDIFGKSLCYCTACRNKFKSRYGYDIPSGEEKLAEASGDVVKFLDDCAKEMLEDIVGTVKGIDPEVKVTINFASLYNKQIRDMLDYQFTEPWAGNWLSAAYARDTAKGQYPQPGPGDVSDVYNYQPENIYILAAAQIAAQNCRVFMYSGSQHTDGTLEHEEARRIGKAYAEIEKFDEYLYDREVIADIGIIQSDRASCMNDSTAVIANAISRVKTNSRHRFALLGAMKACDYSKFSWNILLEQEVCIEKARKYKVLILPNVFYVSESLRKVLEEYVACGGVLISAGETGLYDENGKKQRNLALEKLYGCTFLHEVDTYKDNEWGSYLSLIDNPVWKHVPPTYPPVESKRYRVESNTARVLASFINPATPITEDKWVNWWCPPPSEATNEPAVLENIFGKGRVLYCGFDLFSMENKGFNWVKDFIGGVLECNIECPAVKLDTAYPNILGYVSYDRTEHREIIIHEVSCLAETTKGDAPAISGGAVSISAEVYAVESAEIVYPCRSELDVTRKNGRYFITLPDIEIHQVIRLRYSDKTI